MEWVRCVLNGVDGRVRLIWGEKVKRETGLKGGKGFFVRGLVHKATIRCSFRLLQGTSQLMRSDE